MAVTIKDVARHAEVSSATVSAVISGNSKYVRVGMETRKRVQEAMKELGYSPNLYARTMKNGQTFTIGLIISDILSVPTALLVKGTKPILSEKGYHIILGPSSDDSDQELFYIENFLSRRVDGFIVVPSISGETLPRLKKLRQSGIPLVICERPWVTDIDGVYSNFEDGTYEAANYLIELGHKKIAFCMGNPQTPSTKGSAQIRYYGYRRALEEHGIPLRKDYTFSTTCNDSTGGWELAEIILTMKEPPTAVIARNDEIAAGLLKFMIDRGVSVPRHLSVIGFGNKEMTETLQVPLTTIESPKFEVGKKAAELLIEKIQQVKEADTKDIQPPISIGLMPRLIKRETCAAPSPNLRP